MRTPFHEFNVVVAIPPEKSFGLFGSVAVVERGKRSRSRSTTLASLVFIARSNASVMPRSDLMREAERKFRHVQQLHGQPPPVLRAYIPYKAKTPLNKSGVSPLFQLRVA